MQIITPPVAGICIRGDFKSIPIEEEDHLLIGWRCLTPFPLPPR